MDEGRRLFSSLESPEKKKKSDFKNISIIRLCVGLCNNFVIFALQGLDESLVKFVMFRLF